MIIGELPRYDTSITRHITGVSGQADIIVQKAMRNSSKSIVPVCVALRSVPTKKSGTLRVLVLGGSSTFNFGARNGRTWSVRLASFLGRRLGIEVEVMNAGTPGYTTYQSSMRLKEQLIEFNPDIVIVYHLWNDMKTFSYDDPRENNQAMGYQWKKE